MNNYQEVANIPSNYTRIIARELGLNLREIPELIKFTGLNIHDFMREDLLLTAIQFIRILQNSLLMAKHQNFGLSLGKRLTSNTHGMMGFLINNSPNLAIALKAFQNFLPTRISFARVELEYTPQFVAVSLHFNIDLPSDVHRMLSETCTVALAECAAFIIGQPLKNTGVYFSHPEPEDQSIYLQYFCGQCHFNAEMVKVDIPLEFCEIPNVSANQEHYALAMLQCEKLIQELKPVSKNYTYEIQKIMLSHPISELSEDAVANMLFISRRTLARRLQKEGINFRKLTEEIKSKQALSYLCDNKLPVETIAMLLNYHDSSSFRRAFKKWYGVPPSEYRKHQMSDQAL